MRLNCTELGACAHARDVLLARARMTCVARAFVCTVSGIVFFVYVHIYVSVCNFSKLVCDLLPRRLFDGSAEKALPEEYLSHTILTSNAWEDFRLI